MKQARTSLGFGLIELMVAMVAGLVVLSAVLMFIASMGQSVSTNIRSIRLMQELRSSLNVIEREIRRSGYDETAYKFVGSCVSVTGVCPMSNFNSLIIATGSCLVVSYDNGKKTTPGAVSAGEFHGFRLTPNAAGVGVIQASLAGATAPNCSDAANSANWLAVSNPSIIDVTNLNFTQPTTVGGCVPSPIGLWIVVQDVLVQINGQWVDPASHVVSRRSIEESVRVKNDRMSTTRPAVCT
jgi:uncharacterized membrane protein